MEVVNTSLYEIACHGLPLKRLGLFLKAEYAFGEDDDEIFEENSSEEVLKADVNQKALKTVAQKRRFADTISRAEQKMRDFKKLKKADDDHGHQVQLTISDKKEIKKNPTVDCKRDDDNIISKAIAKQREGARMALQQMEKIVDFNENMESHRELQKLRGSYVWSYEGGLPLKSLGLFLKPEYNDGEDKDEDEEVRSSHEDLEEGEISDEEYWEEVDILN